MTSPNDRKYTESHEWLKLDGNTVTLGITPFAVSELTDITYVEMKPVGTDFSTGDSVGEVESVKATSDIYTPIAGELVEFNEALSDNPSLVNDDPLDSGWLVRIKVSDASALEELMDSGEYDSKYGG
ncbi:glycine cleavage system protein GcvH [Planctomycetaceae bacterium AH-315-I19]|nr:glycine cleavage system protein GcvH [Planctomycetaceae bacterium AH-315-I19]